MSRLLLQCLLLWPLLVASLQSAISSLGQKAAAFVNVGTTPCHYRQITGSSEMTSMDFDPKLKEESKVRNLKNVARLPGTAELLVKAMQQDPLLKQLAINNQFLAHVISSPDASKKMLRAAFPDFNALDHLQDNVNARVHELSRSSWDLRRIRSIHYTGPLKPCYTHAEDFAEEDWDQRGAQSASEVTG
eukprot:s360_g3.t1